MRDDAGFVCGGRAAFVRPRVGRVAVGLLHKAQANELDLPLDRIPDEFAANVVRYVGTIKTKTAKNAALQIALHEAAQGDFDGAGKLWREQIYADAIAAKFIRIGGA